MDEEVTNRKRRIASAQEAREWLLDYNYYRNGPIALMLIGIRDLKQINDREGRDAGDEAIRQTAARIAGYLEISALEVGLFAKMPGREFLVLLKGDIPKSKLSDEARIMVDTLISLPKIGDGNIPVSVRIGLSKSKAGESGHELLHRTEAALSLAYAGKRERLEEVSLELEDPNVWNQPERAQALGRERAQLEAVVDTLDELSAGLLDQAELAGLLLEDNDEDGLAEVDVELGRLGGLVSDLEFRRMFSGEADPNNAYLDIQAGSGGTEAQDWASMLLRMYLRWCEKKGFKVDVVEMDAQALALLDAGRQQ